MAHNPSRDTLQLFCCCLLDQDLGDVLPHLHAAALWTEKKSFTINPACAAVDCKTFLWVWISVLGAVPNPRSQTYLGEEFSVLLNTSRGGCAQVRRRLCQPRMFLSGHTLKWEDALTKPQRHAVTCNIYSTISTVTFKHNQTETVST